jgi:pimeloyl-ACP methyl ester carboxylesterase
MMAAGTLAVAAATNAQTIPKKPKPPVTPNPGVSPIDRAFVRIAEGPVHYRYMDARGRTPELPIVMLHASPGSSERLVPLIPGLASNRLVVALDTLGNGDSPPPAMRETTIAYYVDATLRVLDQLEIERADFYGTHTGAQIAAEMAVRHPERMRKIAFDGLALFTDDYKKEAIANYAPEMKPQADGSHLMWAWNRSGTPTTPPDEKQASVMMQLKALTTYHIAYKAAFSHDVHALLPKITQEVLVMAIKRDPLHEYLDAVAAGIKGSRKVLVPTEAGAAGKSAALRDFFGIKA